MPEVSWIEHNAGILITGVAGLLTTIIAGFLSMAAGRGSIAVQVQAALNASALQLTQLQEKHIGDCEARCEALEATVRSLKAHIGALERALRSQGFDIPRQPLTETVFVLDSQSTPTAPGSPKETR